MASRFDYVILTLGYYRFAVPKELAYKFLDAFQGENVYKVDDEYVEGKTRLLVSLLPYDQMPKITVLNPVEFHMGIENYRMKEEEKARKDNAT